MDTILLFTTSSGKARTEMLAGVREFASDANWNVQVFEYGGAPFPASALIRFWKPSGCIVEGSGNNSISNIFPRNAFGKTPVVYIGSDPLITPKSATIVIHDARAAASLAAKELLQPNPKTLAFLGMKSKVWSERRKDAFTAAARLNGKEVEVLDIPISGMAGSNTSSSKLKAWLKRLEKPVGLFAADDTLAEMALSICRMSDLSSPDEIAVVGVDDNESICEHTLPTLSSIRPDFRQGGRFAARLLAKQLLGARRIPRETVFSVVGITRRGSTRTFKRKDADVAAAIERIHKPDGMLLSPVDILNAFPCSRRNAEIRFRKAVGRSVLDELIDARITLAKSFLEDTALPISSIAEQCGYRSQTQFRKIFLNATGHNPLHWRQCAKRGEIHP